MEEAKPQFLYEDHPDHPGWKRWGLKNSDRYNTFLGDMMVRVEEGMCRVRMLPERRHSNLGNNVHGGAMLGFIDVSLFAAARSRHACLRTPPAPPPTPDHRHHAGRPPPRPHGIAGGGLRPCAAQPGRTHVAAE